MGDVWDESGCWCFAKLSADDPFHCFWGDVERGDNEDQCE
jgi:hypothetical protein